MIGSRLWLLFMSVNAGVSSKSEITIDFTLDFLQDTRNPNTTTQIELW